MALPKVGVAAVVEGLPSFMKGMEQVNSITKNVSASMEKTLSKNKGFASAGEALNKFTGIAKNAESQILSQIPVIGSFSDEIAAISNPALAAVAAITALTIVITGLGIEGGKIKGVEESFHGITAGVGQVSDVLLGKLRDATANTISDFELMRQTNIALAGSTGEFGKQFGEALPRVLELARAQARATGTDVDFLVQSLISGIKRASPLLIDNTGIVLKVGAANEALAQKLGKSVEALSAEEKQIAVLNAVLEAGERTTRAYGETQDYANIKFAQAQASIQNMINGIQVAVEPLASAVLNVVNLVLENITKIGAGIGTILQPIINIIASIINAITGRLAPIINFIGSVIGDIFTTIGYAVETVLAPFQVLIDVFGEIGSAVVELLLKPFGWLFDLLNSAVTWIIDRARDFLKAGAILIGGLAAGMLRAANTLVLPTVIAIATLIADFLVGASPPPKGPLSKIDQGGAAVMESWLQGFVGVSLDPIDQVTAEVSARMGDIGRLNIEQVNERLKSLDKALMPFQARLDLVKASFEALKPVTEAAFNSLDRQMDVAIAALAAGDQNAAETVRGLDAQRAALEAYMDAQQERIDQQQIQVALAQAQQAQERTLLEIRKRQLEIDAIKDPVAKEKAQKELDKKKEKKGSGEAPAALAGGGLGGAPALPKGGGFAGELVDLAEAGFEFGGGTEELAKFTQGSKMLQDQFKRIGDAPFMAGIKEKLDEFAKWFDPDNPEGVIAKALGFLTLQSDPANPAGLVGWFAAIPANVTKAVSGLEGIIRTQVIAPISKAFSDAFDPDVSDSLANKLNTFFTGDGDGTLKGILTSPLKWFQDVVVAPLQTKFNTELFNLLFSFTDPNSFAGKVALFFLGKGEGSFQALLTAPLEWMQEKFVAPLTLFFTDLWNNVFNPDTPTSFGGMFKNFWDGRGAGTLNGILESAGTWVKGAIANPFIKALNFVVRALESFINDKILGALRGLAQQFIDFLTSIGQGGSGIVSSLKDFQGKAMVQLGSIPELAQGGILGRGVFKSGERGPEIGMSAAPFAMFSNKFVNAIDLFADVMAKPMPMPIPAGGSTTNNNQQSMVNNFYGIDKPQDTARRIALLRAKR